MITDDVTGPLPDEDVDRWRRRIGDLMPGVHTDLAALVRIPSVSAPSFDQAHVEAGAGAVARLFRDAGLPEIEVIRAEGPHGPGAPAVLGNRPGRPDAPTVLLYAHHDVQPPGEDGDWTTPPFEPTERNGRLYGRGAADDKAGVMVHVAALRALLGELGDDPGVGVTIFVEGEEEIGSPTFSALLAEHRDRLAADVVVVADSANWRVGVPALTTSLRGLVDGTITVRTLAGGLHSGFYGGAVPDAMLVMVRLLDTLWTRDGSVAVTGLTGSTTVAVDYPESHLRDDAGLLPGVDLIGSGPLASRLWTQPAITITGIDAPPVARASNTLLASVRVKFTMRVAPGQPAREALAALQAHVEDHVPFGAQVEVVPGEAGEPFAARTDSATFATAEWALSTAWQEPCLRIGVGGSIPFVAELATVYPSATVLFTGVEDPDTRAHGADESLHLGDFERACLAETLLLAALGRHAGS